MSATFVTALYKMKRPDRSFDDYKRWFSETLTIPYPMVVYTEESNRELVEKSRGSLPTKVFYTKVPLIETKTDVERIIKNAPANSNIAKVLAMRPYHVEFTCFEYIPIIHSKFSWMKEAADANFFNTESVFWVDAGLSRFFNFRLDKISIKTHILNERKLYLQVGRIQETYDLLHGNLNIDDYIGRCVNFMMAGFWGGPNELIHDVCSLGLELYQTEYLDKNRVDNEQTLFAFIMKKYRDQLTLVAPGFKQEYSNFVNFFNILLD